MFINVKIHIWILDYNRKSWKCNIFSWKKNLSLKCWEINRNSTSHQLHSLQIVFVKINGKERKEKETAAYMFAAMFCVAIFCCWGVFVIQYFQLWSNLYTNAPGFPFSLIYLTRIFILFTNLPEMVLNALQILSHSIFVPTLWRGFYLYPYFTDRKPEAQFGERNGLSSHSQNRESQDSSPESVLFILLITVLCCLYEKKGVHFRNVFVRGMERGNAPQIVINIVFTHSHSTVELFSF